MADLLQLPPLNKYKGETNRYGTVNDKETSKEYGWSKERSQDV